MHENRTSYPRKKARMYQQLQELPGRYRSLTLIKMDKVRSAQILTLRKILKGEVEFFSVKDKVARKALAQVDVPGIDKMIPELAGQCMFIFTDMSPFRLNVLLAKNRIMTAARGGDAASIDVVIPAVNTGVALGPMLTEFKEAGIPTKIDQGTIWIAKETVPVLKGEIINEKLASILGKLDIKSVEAGVSLHAAVEDGLKYTAEELVVDIEKVREEMSRAHQEAVSLSVEAAYVTPENIRLILAKASQSARSLSVESGFMTADTREQVLQRADAQARALASLAKDYTPG